ncbi:MAG: crossover junction endodeoxyribonuclease RuvC [Mailhella sp.]|nr:crossover junction endodeoxyribonuclease RuvC [Mailhella sp.]
MRVIGIDPGSVRTGWGVVDESGSRLSVAGCGVIEAEGNAFADRLAHIFRELRGIVGQYRPEEAGVEQAFTAKNAATALKLGQARGVAVAACAANGVPVFDYDPRLVKKNIVGTGTAEKEQVAFMVSRILGMDTDGMLPDATDALGIAICHLSMRRMRLLERETAKNSRRRV